MTVEEQVLSIEQAKHLQKLGMDMSDAAFTWHTNLYTKDTHLGTGYLGRKRSVYTYTLQEVLSKLPKEVDGYSRHIEDTSIEYRYVSYPCGYLNIDTLIDIDKDNLFVSAYETLCWLIKNGYLKEDKE